jgi:hypothetical protein
VLLALNASKAKGPSCVTAVNGSKMVITSRKWLEANSIEIRWRFEYINIVLDFDNSISMNERLSFCVNFD